MTTGSQLARGSIAMPRQDKLAESLVPVREAQDAV